MNRAWQWAVLVGVIVGGLLTPGGPAPARADGPDIWPTAGWSYATPEEQGMDSAQLLDVLTEIERSDLNINSVTVVRHGQIVLDAYLHPFAEGDRHIIHSCTKSFMSALIGIAIRDGYLEGPQQRLVDIFPDREMAHMDADKAAITLGDILMMASGWECRDSYLYNWQGLRELRASEDWVQHVLDLPMSEAPGTRFEYCNEASFLLSAIIQKVTGQSAFAFAQENLFGPLGFGEVIWPENPDGINIGWGDMRMSPHDMAKFGYLYLHNGQWDGVQIIPAEWVAVSTRAQIAAGTLGANYGYQWWIESDQIYAAEGYAGQFIFVVPDRDMVVVFTSGLNGRYFESPQQLLESVIIPAAQSDEPLPANPDALAELTARVDALANPQPQPVPDLPEAAKSASGIVYDLADNDLGFQTLVMTVEDGADAASLVIEGAWSSLRVQIGLDGVFHIVQDEDGENFAARGTWSGATLAFEVRTMRHPWQDRYRVTFDGARLRMTVSDIVNGGTWQITGTAR